MTAMSSFSLGHMNSPEVLFVPPGTGQWWARVCNLLTLENLVYFSILGWAEPFELDAVFQLYLHVRQNMEICYCHSALPLLSCPHECFDRTRKRPSGFLEDRVWLGGWERCHLQEWELHFCCWSPSMQESNPFLLLLSTHQGCDCNLPYITWHNIFNWNSLGNSTREITVARLPAKNLCDLVNRPSWNPNHHDWTAVISQAP